MRHLLAAAALAALVGHAAAVRADAVADLDAEVARVEGARTELEARRAELERKSQDEAREITRLKGEAAGVARDYRLGQLLAAAQERAVELDRLQADLRARGEALTGGRKRLIAAIDRALDEPKLPDARRAELVRRRAAETARMAGGATAVEIARPTADPLDGPADLDEKADLLKDSEERLRREVDRLGHRIEGVEGRRRLRERAGEVDDDLFGELGTGRRLVRVTQLPTVTHGPTGTADNGAAKDSGGAQSPAAGPNGATGGAGMNFAGGQPGGEVPDTRFGVSLRGVIDPSTLDDLRRAEGTSDLEGQLRALKRMQGSLRSLADDLGRREGDLRRRARDIRPRK